MLKGTCVLWEGGLNSSGYGPHRRAWVQRFGPIEPGLEIDHLCKMRACINTDHMELVTRRENNLRSDSVSAQHAAKTHCPKGHEYSGKNVRGERICRACGNEQLKACYRKRQAKKGLSVGLPLKDRTHCPRGHFKNGRSKCMECDRIRHRAGFSGFFANAV